MSVDERGYGPDPPRKKMGVRTAVFASLDVWRFWDTSKRSPIKRITNLGWILRYGMQNGMCGSKKVRQIVDVPGLASAWVEAIVGMVTAHDKDTYDSHDAKADELLGPLLAAPIKQVREFYGVLLEKLEADQRVPMLVIMGYKAWGEVVVKDAPDEGVKRLKNKLAGEIADIVEQPAKDQLREAIMRALRWRDPETLKNVKEQLDKGVKPKLRGRESCLFLEGGRGTKKFSVML